MVRGFIGFIGCIGLIGLIGFIGFVGLFIGFVGSRVSEFRVWGCEGLSGFHVFPRCVPRFVLSGFNKGSVAGTG